MSQEFSDYHEDLLKCGYELGYTHCSECHEVHEIKDMIIIDGSLYCKECVKGE